MHSQAEFKTLNVERKVVDKITMTKLLGSIICISSATVVCSCYAAPCWFNVISSPYQQVLTFLTFLQGGNSVPYRGGGLSHTMEAA